MINVGDAKNEILTALDIANRTCKRWLFEEEACDIGGVDWIEEILVPTFPAENSIFRALGPDIIDGTTRHDAKHKTRAYNLGKRLFSELSSVALDNKKHGNTFQRDSEEDNSPAGIIAVRDDGAFKDQCLAAVAGDMR